MTNYQQELVNSGRIKRIYLDEIPSGSIGMGLIELIISQENQAPEIVKNLMSRTEIEISNDSEREGIIDLLETVLLSKFSQLSRQEIEAMFLVNDIQQTKVYQEAKLEGKLEGRQEGRQEGKQEGRQEGKQEGEKNLLLRQLSKRFGKLKYSQIQTINKLTIEQLEDLGEALLDFDNVNDLDEWLKSHT